MSCIGNMRSFLFGAVVLCCGSFAVAAASANEDVLSQIEQPAAAIQQMRELPRMLAAAAQPPINPEALKAAEAATLAAYQVEPMERALSAGMTQAHIVSDADLTAAAERFRATSQELDTLLATEPETRSQELAARYDKRADKEAIADLVEDMAAPELRGEIMLTAERLRLALDLRHKSGIELFRSVDEAALQSQVAVLVQQTRDVLVAPSEPFSRTSAVAEGKARLRAQLTLLSEADVSALTDFYESEAGRAGRKALVSSFAAQNDENAKTMLTAFIKALKSGS